MRPSSRCSSHHLQTWYVAELITHTVSVHLNVGKVLKLVVEDTHYKYLVLFLIPTSSYFAIANWVGWQYYQNT